MFRPNIGRNLCKQDFVFSVIRSDNINFVLHTCNAIPDDPAHICQHNVSLQGKWPVTKINQTLVIEMDSFVSTHIRCPIPIIWCLCSSKWERKKRKKLTIIIMLCSFEQCKNKMKKIIYNTLHLEITLLPCNESHIRILWASLN